MLLDDGVVIQITNFQKSLVLFEFFLIGGGFPMGLIGVFSYLEEDFLESGDADSIGANAQDVKGRIQLSEEVLELGC
jgi:hypothetical protein